MDSLRSIDGPKGWKEVVEGLYFLDAHLGFPSGKVRIYFLSMKHLFSYHIYIDKGYQHQYEGPSPGRCPLDQMWAKCFW
jgi:hypothetical protein